MTADTMYRLWTYILGKNKSSGYASPDDFRLIMSQAQRSYIAYLLGSLPQYTPGRPVANVELGQNLPVRTRLTPSIYQYNLTIDATGHSNYPGDYIQVDSQWSIYGLNTASIYNYKRIRFVQQHQLDSYLNSVIDPVASNPIYLIQDNGFQFFPVNQAQARLSYVRHAPDIVWGYTLDGSGRPVYSQALSADPIWDDVACYDIVGRALSMAGINLQSGAVLQYSEELKKVGQ